MSAVMLPSCATTDVPLVPGLSMPSPEIREDVFTATALGLHVDGKMPSLPISGITPAVINVHDLDNVMLDLTSPELTGDGQGGDDWMTQCLDFGDLVRFAEVDTTAEVPSMSAKHQSVSASKRKQAPEDGGMESADSYLVATSEDDAATTAATAAGRKRARVTAARSRDVMDKKMVRLDKRNAELKSAISETQGEIDQVVRLMRLIFQRRRKAPRSN